MSDRSNKSRRKLNNWEKRALKIPTRDWAPVHASMLESPAFRVLSRAAFLCLTCMWAIHARTGRHENGRLAVTYDMLVGYGVDRKQIRSALDELDALGFIKRTREGRRGFGIVKGMAAEYRLTWEGVIRNDDSVYPTDEWRRFDTLEKAAAAQAAAKKPKVKRVKPAADNVVPLVLRHAA